MGCICSILKALTSYHGTHLTPDQIARQRLSRTTVQTRLAPESNHEQSGPSATQRIIPTSGQSSPQTPGSPAFTSRSPHLSPSNKTACRSRADTDSGSVSMLRRFQSVDYDQQSTRSCTTSPQKCPTFVNKSPRLHHQRSLQGSLPTIPSSSLSSSATMQQRQTSLSATSGSKHVTFDMRGKD